MKSIYYLCLFVLLLPALGFTQTTFEVRDAFTFESVNGLSFKTKAKLSQQTNTVYQIESPGSRRSRTGAKICSW